MAVVSRDPGKAGEFVVQLSMPAGYKIPPHFHPADEHVTVLSGSLWMAMGEKWEESAGKEMQTGAYHMIPKGVRHYAWAKGQTVIQLHGMGPWGITYVNPADDPRKKAANK